MRQFIEKMGGIVMLIATVLLMESVVMENLHWLAGLVLVPASALLAVSLLRAGAKPPRRKARRAPQGRGARRPAAVPAAHPPLRVVQGRHRPDDPWAA